MAQHLTRRLQRELADIQRNGVSPTIHVAQGDDLRVFDVLIFGPPDTPYDGAGLHFQVNVPEEYPLKPPQVRIVSTDGGALRIHPQFYSSGKVCLSILGTWKGPQWSASMSLRTLLLSLQALLNEEPLRCEPGFENAANEEVEAANAFVVHEAVRVLALKQVTGAASWGQGDQQVEKFSDAMRAYLAERRGAILARLEKLSQRYDGKPLGEPFELRCPSFLRRRFDFNGLAIALAQLPLGDATQTALESKVGASSFTAQTSLQACGPVLKPCESMLELRLGSTEENMARDDVCEKTPKARENWLISCDETPKATPEKKKCAGKVRKDELVKLTSDLLGKKISELVKLARASGAAEEDIDEALDAEDTKAALVAVLVNPLANADEVFENATSQVEALSEEGDATDAPVACRICLHTAEESSSPLIVPCRCSGSISHVHGECLLNWLNRSNAKADNAWRCDICRQEYRVRLGGGRRPGLAYLMREITVFDDKDFDAPGLVSILLISMLQISGSMLLGTLARGLASFGSTVSDVFLFPAALIEILDMIAYCFLCVIKFQVCRAGHKWHPLMWGQFGELMHGMLSGIIDILDRCGCELPQLVLCQCAIMIQFVLMQLGVVDIRKPYVSGFQRSWRYWNGSRESAESLPKHFERNRFQALRQILPDYVAGNVSRVLACVAWVSLLLNVTALIRLLARAFIYRRQIPVEVLPAKRTQSFRQRRHEQ